MTFALVSASMMAADHARLGDEMRAMEAAGVDQFHWDIMDGHFVPNLTFGPDIVRALRPVTQKYFDVHLMVSNPSQWITPFADAGANNISFHVEAADDVKSVIKQIKERDIHAGLTFNPGTNFDVDDEIMSQIDTVLIMTVRPGFGGQGFIDMADKIKKVAAWREKYSKLQIIVDGGINNVTAKNCILAGATTLVSGSYLFKGNAYQDKIQSIRQAAS